MGRIEGLKERVLVVVPEYEELKSSSEKAGKPRKKTAKTSDRAPGPGPGGRFIDCVALRHGTAPQQTSNVGFGPGFRFSRYDSFKW